MDIKKERFVAYCAAVALFVVGVVCYAAFPDRKPDEPVRVMFHSTAGNVLFFHKYHATKKEYGLECTDCHHQWVKSATGKILYLRKDDSTGDKPVACRTCHVAEKPEGENTKQPKLSNDVQAGKEKSVRAMLEKGLEPKLSDAIHERCGGCHDKTGHGPGTKDCSGCHVT